MDQCKRMGRNPPMRILPARPGKKPLAQESLEIANGVKIRFLHKVMFDMKIDGHTFHNVPGLVVRETLTYNIFISNNFLRQFGQWSVVYDQDESNSAVLYLGKPHSPLKIRLNGTATGRKFLCTAQENYYLSPSEAVVCTLTVCDPYLDDEVQYRFEPLPSGLVASMAIPIALVQIEADESECKYSFKIPIMNTGDLHEKFVLRRGSRVGYIVRREKRHTEAPLDPSIAHSDHELTLQLLNNVRIDSDIKNQLQRCSAYDQKRSIHDNLTAVHPLLAVARLQCLSLPEGTVVGNDNATSSPVLPDDTEPVPVFASKCFIETKQGEVMAPLKIEPHVLYKDPQERMEQVEKQLDLSETNLSQPQMDRLMEVIKQRHQCCALSRLDVGYCTIMPCEVTLKPGAKPVKAVPYKLSRREEEILNVLLDEWEASGQVEPVEVHRAIFTSPVLLVSKKRVPDFTDPYSFRIVVDNRGPNKAIYPSNMAMHSLELRSPALAECKYLSLIDISGAFNSVALGETARDLFCLITPSRVLRYKVMPQGLNAAPSSWVQLINYLFNEKTTPFCIVYVDDVLVISRTEEDHFKHISMVLDILVEANLRINLKKCKFFAQSVTYLGIKLSTTGVKVTEQRVAAIQERPAPKNVKQLQSFLGATRDGTTAQFCRAGPGWKKAGPGRAGPGRTRAGLGKSRAGPGRAGLKKKPGRAGLEKKPGRAGKSLKKP